MSTSYLEMSDKIFPCLGGHFPKRQLPDDVVLYNIAGQFDVHFIVFGEDDHGREVDVVITAPLLKRWRVQ